MRIGVARGGIADGETLIDRDFAGVLVVDRPADLCQLYMPVGDGFEPAADWSEPRSVDMVKVDDTADGPKYDVMAHPHERG